MKTFRIALALILTFICSFNTEAQPNVDLSLTNNLQKITVDKFTLLYVSKEAQPFAKGTKINFGYADDESSMPLAKLNLSSNQKESIIIAYSDGASDDPQFIFYKETQPKKYQYLFTIDAEQLIIPGNSFIYSSGSANNMFDQRRKFKVVNDALTEIKQPFYAIGLKTKTLKAITIYSDKNLKTPVATIAANSPIEVVASEYNEEEIKFFLIKSEFGLLGWWKQNDSSAEEIKGLIYNGD